jgi:heptosyltransferase II
MNIGIYLPNWIGDVVMATPTLRAMRRKFPSAAITGIMRPCMAEVLAGTEWLDDVVFHEPKKEKPEHRTAAVVAELRRRQLDLLLLLAHSMRSGIFAWRSGAKERVGYARNGRSLLLTTTIKPPRKGWQPIPVPQSIRTCSWPTPSGARRNRRKPNWQLSPTMKPRPTRCGATWA